MQLAQLLDPFFGLSVRKIGTIYGASVAAVFELSSSNIPPKIIPSSIPAGCSASLVISAPPLTPFFKTPKWNSP